MTLLRSALTAFAVLTLMTTPVWAEMAPPAADDVPAAEATEPAVETTSDEGPEQAAPDAASSSDATPSLPHGVDADQDAAAGAEGGEISGQGAIAAYAEKARADAEKMYDGMDVVGYMVFDQKGRSCAADSKAKETLCLMIQDDFLEVMERDDFKADCRARSVDMLVNTLDPHTIAYGAAYHAAVDHKRVKAIINDPEYKREDLKAYMDGALQEVAAKGFNPAETKTRERVQRIRKDVMALCAQLVGQYSRHNPDKQAADKPADAKPAPEAEPTKEAAPE